MRIKEIKRKKKISHLLGILFCASAIAMLSCFGLAFNTIRHTVARKADIGKTVGFFHMFASEPDLLHEVISEQINTLESSGILEKVDSIHYAYFGPNHESFRIPSLSGTFKKSNISKESGIEPSTLTILHSHCLQNLQDIVFYIHSKGSFHPSIENTALRQNLMFSVIYCLNYTNIWQDSDLCGFKVSPIPYPQLSGAIPTDPTDGVWEGDFLSFDVVAITSLSLGDFLSFKLLSLRLCSRFLHPLTTLR